MIRKRTMQQNPRKRSLAPRRVLRPLLVAAALGAGFLALTAPPSAHADGAVYQQHFVNAGVLVNSPGADPAPYLFYVLNRRPDARPPDLTFVNPLASASLTPEKAAYWEVPLNDVSDSELSRYNVLYLRADGLTFGPVVNEKLRRFVDGGGQLIVEYGAAAAPAQGLFTGSEAASVTASAVTFPAASTPPAPELHQPLVSQPYFLSQTDLFGLGVPPGATATANLGMPTLYLTFNTADSLHGAEFKTLFSPALIDTSGPVVSAAQIGAGQVVVSTLNFGGGITVDPTYRGPTGTGPYVFNPANLYVAPAADLKLLSNIVTYAEAHPNGNKTSHGDASNTGLASFSPAWQFPVQSSNAVQPPPGAAVWGNFVFVTDATGTLHAFDAYPSENLTGTANGAGAEQIAPLSVQYPTTSYDDIWRLPLGANASAPTVASFNGTNYVFVELANGNVIARNAVTGAAGPTLTPPALPTGSTVYTAPAPTYPQSGVANAPSPTFYDGRIYAGQANGSLHVYDLNEGTSYFVPLNPTPPTGVGAAEPVTGAPAVGLLTGGDASVLTAVVPTQYNMYSVLLGARNEPLRAYTSGGTQTGYSINRSGRYDVANLFADTTSIAPPLQAYDSNGIAQTFALTTTSPPSPQDPLFTTGIVGSYFTDWDMDFKNAVTSGGGTSQVNLNSISAFSYGEVNSTPTSGATAMSAPAIDRHGNAYYTETNGANSYVVAVGTAALHSNVRLNFRFLIPTATGLVDADGVDYSPLLNYRFVGAPVVDDQGNVYAAATNGTLATMLCFRGNQPVAAVLPTGSTIDLTTTTITQPDENVPTEDNSIFRGPDTNVGAANATYGQFIGSPTSLTFYNFGKRGSTFSQIAGSLTEPQPVFATDTLGTNTKTQLNMRTNLAWYVQPFPVSGPVTGLSQVGSSLFLSDGVKLFRLSTKPTVGTGRVVTTPPVGVPLGAGTGGLGTLGAPPSVGGSVMIVNGEAGIQALTRQITVIADSGRVLGVDGDGGAVWAVDATTRTDTVSNTATKVAFSHPAALSQFALNDYLAADTGNNRCVRFDSGGNVLWELTRFQDPYGILAAGQPLTLSQPSSVVVRANVPLPANYPQYPNGTATYYLVADSGNNRVLEVADIVDSTGLHSHILTWASHTGDRNGRSYRYGSAAYYPNPTLGVGRYSVAATVVNTQIGTLAAAGGPGSVSGDAPGGSIAVFNQPAAPQAFNTTPTPASDLAYVAAGFYAGTLNASGTVVYTPFTVRNPRFLQLYTPPASTTAPNANVAPFDFLYADDNGAFDLSYDTTRKAFVAGPDRLHFTGTDYKGMGLTAFGVGPVSRTYLPFTASAVQGLSSDSQPAAGGAGTTVRRYLITQSHSQGELGSAAGGKIGGEVFEVDVTASGTTATSQPVGGFSGGETLSHPALAGPLIQPTDALRLP